MAIEHRGEAYDIRIAPETETVERDELVARWYLNYPCAFANSIAYSGPNELPFYYKEEMATQVQMVSQNKAHLFTLGTVDPCFWAPTETRERSLELCYLGKSSFKGEWFPDWLRITRDWPVTQEHLRDLLTRAKSVYSCDNFSSLNWEAKVAGADLYLLINSRWHLDTTPLESYDRFLIYPERELQRTRRFVELIKQFLMEKRK